MNENPAAVKSPSRSRLTVVLANVALLAFGTVIALLVVELIVRLVMPQQLISIRSDIWQPHDGLGWIVRPGIDTTINTGERTVSIMTDENGFRIGNDTSREGERQVLVVGDSFMQALQVEHEQSLAGLMQARLNDALPGESIVVRNGGVDDWGPSHYLLRTRAELENGSYDLVVVAIYLGNDIVKSAQDYFPPRKPTTVRRLRLPRAFSWREWVDSIMYPINDSLEVRSHLYILSKSSLRGALIRLGLTADYVPVGVRLAEADHPMWDVSAEIIKQIQLTADTHNTPVLFVLIPTPFSIDPLVFEQIRAGFGEAATDLDVSQPDRLMSDRLKSKGIPFVSASEYFSQQHEHVQLYGHIDRHLSPEGHAALYELLEPNVLDAMAPGRSR